MADSRDNAGRPIGRRGDDTSTGRIFFVDRECERVQPFGGRVVVAQRQVVIFL